MNVILSYLPGNREEKRYIDPIGLQGMIQKNPNARIIYDNYDNEQIIEEALSGRFLHLFSDHSYGIKKLGGRAAIKNIIVLDTHLDFAYCSSHDGIIKSTYATWIDEVKKRCPHTNVLHLGASSKQAIKDYSLELLTWADTIENYAKNIDDLNYVAENIAFMPAHPITFEYNEIKQRFEKELPGRCFDEYMDSRKGWHIDENKICFADSIEQSLSLPIKEFLSAANDSENTLLSLDVDALSSDKGDVPVEYVIPMIVTCKEMNVGKYNIALEHVRLIIDLWRKERIFRKDLEKIIYEIIA